MDDKFNKDHGIEKSNPDNHDNLVDKDIDTVSGDNINKFIMDKKGNIHKSSNNGAVSIVSPRTFIVLGWIAAAMTLIVSPYFAAAGITFGLLANRQARGSGNYIITANIALALINFILGLFMAVALRRMIFGY